MKYWYGFPVRECECGFSTPDEDDFARHLKSKGHKMKAEPQPKAPVRKRKENKPAEPSAAVQETKEVENA